MGTILSGTHDFKWTQDLERIHDPERIYDPKRTNNSEWTRSQMDRIHLCSYLSLHIAWEDTLLLQNNVFNEKLLFCINISHL